jgi:hypothetical protein
LSPPQHDRSGTSEQNNSWPEKNRYIQSREEEAWWYVVCVHNNKNNNFFFFFFFLLGRNYAQNSKLQQQQSFKTNTNQKPGKLKEERNSKPQSRYTLKTYTFFLLLLLLQNVNTNTHSNTYTHIKQNRNCSAKHVTRMLDKQ